jgi:hypothetical protein
MPIQTAPEPLKETFLVELFSGRGLQANLLPEET